MQRVDAPEILDSDTCSPREAQAVLTVLGRVNRWFGGVATTQKMVDRVAQAAGIKRLSLLEVAAGSGEVPEIVRQRLGRRGIVLDVTLLDMAHSHLSCSHHDLPNGAQKNRIVGNALSLPFKDRAFDVVSCSLFAHHLSPQQLLVFVREALRVSRRAVLINDLVRHPLHLAAAFAGFPIMWNRVAWLDGLTSVRRAYVPEEIESLLPSDGFDLPVRLEISRNFLYRMGVILWRNSDSENESASGRPALPSHYPEQEKI
ncbi:MAG: methyltransferase domain-containing protein [Candidatus Sulfotelmatobacter sp.]